MIKIRRIRDETCKETDRQTCPGFGRRTYTIHSGFRVLH